MYNPREAKADFHIYLLAFYLFAALIALVFLIISANNAKRHIYLDWTGIKTEGQVIAAERGPSTWEERTDQNKDLYQNKSRYTFRFQTKTNETVSGDIIMPSYEAVGTGRTIRNGRIYYNIMHIYQVGDKPEIIYAEKQPNIFLPVEFFNRLKSDRNIALWSLGVIISSVALLIWQIVKYRRFVAESRFY